MPLGHTSTYFFLSWFYHLLDSSGIYFSQRARVWCQCTCHIGLWCMVHWETRSLNICVQHFLYTENQHCDMIPEVLFTMGPYFSLHYITFLRVMDLHTAIQGYISLFCNASCIFFPSCQLPNPSWILCFTLFMPPTHSQNIDRLWHIFPPFDIALPMTQYCFRQYY